MLRWFRWLSNPSLTPTSYFGEDSMRLRESVLGEHTDEQDFTRLLIDAEAEFFEVLFSSASAFTVRIPCSGGKSAVFRFAPDMDGFLRMREGYIGTQEHLINSGSVKEFAINIRHLGSPDKTKWVPSHNGISSGRVLRKRILVDGEPADVSTEWRSVKSVEVLQVLEGAFETEAHLSVHALTSISVDGVSFIGKIDFLKDTVITTGYGPMLPIEGSIGKRLVSSAGERLVTTKTDGSRTDLTTLAQSFAAFDPDQNAVVAMTLYSPTKTMRLNRPGSPERLFVEGRTDGLQKLYTQAFTGAEVKAGTTYLFGSKYMIGELDDPSSVLPGDEV